MIDPIAFLAAAAHWCVSCAPDGNVIPSGLGLLGGAAGAAGGLGGLTPLGDLYPPGTVANPPSDFNPGGSLTWQNPDGTYTTKLGDGTKITGSTPGGPGSSIQFPDGVTDPNEEAQKYPPPPVVQVSGPRTLQETLSTVELAYGLVNEPLLGEPPTPGMSDDPSPKDVGPIGEEIGKHLFEEATKKFVEEATAPESSSPPTSDTGPVMGQTGFVANDDGTITTLNPDGSSSTPNADGSVTTTQPDGTSTTTSPTATPRSGVFSGGNSEDTGGTSADASGGSSSGSNPND